MIISTPCTCWFPAASGSFDPRSPPRLCLWIPVVAIVMKLYPWFLGPWTRCSSVPDYGIGIVGKCLGPTMSKGSTKDGCKTFWTYVSQSVTNVVCIINSKLSILHKKRQSHVTTWQYTVFDLIRIHKECIITRFTYLDRDSACTLLSSIHPPLLLVLSNRK